MLHIPPTNLLLLAAKHEPYPKKKKLYLNEKKLRHKIFDDLSTAVTESRFQKSFQRQQRHKWCKWFKSLTSPGQLLSTPSSTAPQTID